MELDAPDTTAELLNHPKYKKVNISMINNLCGFDDDAHNARSHKHILGCMSRKASKDLT